MPSAVFTDANHICIVTADIDRAVRVWSDKTEWDRGRFSATTVPP